MQGHKDLVVWQKAMDLVLDIYKLTASFPKQVAKSLVFQRLCGSSSNSNPRPLIGWQQHPINTQNALRGWRSVHSSGVVVHTRPAPVFRPAHQPCLHRILMNNSTFSWYSFTVRKARSKKRPCHRRLSSPLALLTRSVELTLIVSKTREIVMGWRGNKMACQ